MTEGGPQTLVSSSDKLRYPSSSADGSQRPESSRGWDRQDVIAK